MKRLIKNWFFTIVPLLLLIAVNAGAIEQKVIIDIEGMTCALCQIAIKKSLSGIEGVKDVKVSYEEKKAWITVNDEVKDNRIKQAVQKAGPYKVKSIDRIPLIK